MDANKKNLKTNENNLKTNKKSIKINKKNLKKFFKKNKSILLIFLVVIIALIIGFTISFDKVKIKIAKNEEPDIVANTNEGVTKEETYEGLKFTNISLITEKGISTFTADVTNTNQTDSTISDVNVNLLDKSGNIIVSLRCNIITPLKPNETRTVTTSVKADLNDVTSKTITKYENTAQN